MADPRDVSSDLLLELYRAAYDPSAWLRFLSLLASQFRSNTAAFRVVDTTAPVVHQSYTVGFEESATRRYLEELVRADPFREPLRAAPAGTMLRSHELISEREYRRSAHYEGVFKPNGNFYAMGGHIERNQRRALQIGLHRPYKMERFSEAERERLEHLSPHLRQAAQLMRLLGDYQAALSQSQAALNRLPAGIWLLRSDLTCRWMNIAAEEAVRTGTWGLHLQQERLCLNDGARAHQLRAALLEIGQRQSLCRTVRLAPTGAALVIAANHDAPHGWFDSDDNVLVFLVEPDRPLQADPSLLESLYGLTPAETRLIGELLHGFDIGEASGRLRISVHTARSQIKSAMQKTGSHRQADLIRKTLPRVTMTAGDCADD